MNQDTLFKYFSGDLNSAERCEVREWVDSSSENKKEFMNQRALYDASLLIVDSSVIDVDSRIVRFRKSMSSIMKIAAVIAVTLILSYVYRNIIDPVIVPMQEISVPAGQQLNMTLADGTDVWLNSGTTLKYPAMFNGEERRVEIDGEAFFKVAKNHECPFYVMTPYKEEIKVLGTTFNVESYSEMNNFSTALLSGKVQVKSDNRVYELSPDQMISKNSEGILTISPIANYDAYRWTEGIISLKNDSFRNMIEKFEKFYGIKIVVDRNDLDNVAYTGKFYIADGLQYALNIIQNDIDFEFYRDRDNNIIHIK